MSVIFQLTPSSEHALNILTIREAVEGTPLQLFQVNPRDLEAALDRRADEGFAVLGDPGSSARGFDFNFEDGHYSVSIGTPATPNDWQTTLQFIQQLASRVGASITDDLERTHTIDSILDVPYTEDILFGLQGVHLQAQRSGLAVMGGPPPSDASESSDDGRDLGG